MTLPIYLYIDDDTFTIHQHKFSGGERPKTLTDEITITGKRSRQFGWGPREWQVTVWLTPDDKTALEILWEEDSAVTYTHNWKIGEDGDEYTVTLDELGFSPKESVCERYLGNIKAKEWR